MLSKTEFGIFATVCILGFVGFVSYKVVVHKQKHVEQFNAEPKQVITHLNKIVDAGEYDKLRIAVNNYSGVTNSVELDEIRKQLEVLRIKKEKRDAEISEKKRIAHLCSVKGASAGVYAFAEIYTKQLLKAPSSADFASILDARIDSIGKCRFVVDSYVDAQNSFGASIRTRFVAVVERNVHSQHDYKMIKHSMK